MSAVIANAVFDLQLLRVAGAEALQKRLRDFSTARLSGLVAESLHAYDEVDAVVTFDSIEIDLGQINESELERHLAAALPRALRQYFAQWINLAQAPHRLSQRAVDAEQASAAAPELIALLAGVDGAVDVRQADVAVRTALVAMPTELRRLLLQHGRKQRTRQRLARLLAEPALAELIRLLAPDEAGIVLDYVTQVRDVHARRAVVSEGRHEFGQAMWEFVLTYLLLERSSHFNAKALAAHTLRQMAARYRTDYAALLQALTACIDALDLPRSQHAALPAILHELQQDHVAKSNSAESHPALQSTVDKRLHSIEVFLQRGVLPWSEQGRAGFGFIEQIRLVLEEHPDRLAAMLRRIGAQEPVRRRLAQQLSEALFGDLLVALEPADAAWIRASTHDIERRQAAGAIVSARRSSFGKELLNFILHALLVERGSHFNKRSYIKSLLQQMAAHYGIAYETLLRDLIVAWQRTLQSSRRKDALPNILLELRAESSLRPAQTAAAVSREVSSDVTTAARDPATERALHAVVVRALLIDEGGLDAPSIHALLHMAAARHGVDPDALLWLARRDIGMRLQQDDVDDALLALRDELTATPQQATQTSTAVDGAVLASARFVRARREFVVRGWLEERGSVFNRRSFIKDLLHKLAQRHGLTYRQLLLGLIEQTMPRMHARMRPTALPGILWSLQEEAASAIATPREAPASIAGKPGPVPQVEFLESGTWPAQANQRQWRRLLEHGLWFGNKERFVSALREACRQGDIDSIAKRLVDYLPPANLTKLLMLLSPQYGGFIQTYLLAAELLVDGAGWQESMRGEVARLHWQEVLHFLLARPTGFTLKELLSNCGERVTQKLRIPEQQYAAVLLATCAQRAVLEARFRPLLDLLQGHYGSKIGVVASQATSAQSARQDAPLSHIDYFLRFGRRRFASAQSAATDPAGTTYWQTALAERPAELRALLARRMGYSLERARLLSLPAALRERLLQLLLESGYADLLEARTLASSGSTHMARHAVSLVEHALQFAASGKPYGCADLLDGLLAQLVRDARGDAEYLLTHLEDAIARRPNQHPLLSEKLVRIRQALARATRKKEEKAMADRRPQPGETFEVGNAGLVLLHPFLERYFDGLGMLAERRFANAACQYRAAHLLQYLCSGEIEAAEHNMLLNKILCGLPGDAVLETGGPLTEPERKLSEQLLHSVTQLWEKLKNTSIDGLRSTFLVRDGRLRRDEADWKLTVANSAFDVLLTTLPWSIATIRLPWMENPLWVQWK